MGSFLRISNVYYASYPRICIAFNDYNFYYYRNNFSKIIGNQDELLRQEEYETNDFLYGKLRNSEVLSVYALASNFRKTWVENKQKFYITFSNSQKRPMLFKILSSSIDFSIPSITIGALLVIYGN